MSGYPFTNKLTKMSYCTNKCVGDRKVHTYEECEGQSIECHGCYCEVKTIKEPTLPLFSCVFQDRDYSQVKHYQASDIDKVYTHIFNERFLDFFRDIKARGGIQVKSAELYGLSIGHKIEELYDDIESEYVECIYEYGWEEEHIAKATIMSMDEIRRIFTDSDDVHYIIKQVEVIKLS